VGTLSRIRFALGTNGRPTKRLIDCLDDNVETRYDKNYDFEVVGVAFDGKRIDD